MAEAIEPSLEAATMSKGYKPPAEPDPTGIEDDQVSNTQEAVPIPLIMGERKVPVKWLSRIYKQFSKPAPVERPGKK